MTNRNINVDSCSFEFTPEPGFKNDSNETSDYFYFLKSECLLQVYYDWSNNNFTVKVAIHCNPNLSEDFYVTMSLSKGKNNISCSKKLIKEPWDCMLSFNLSDIEINLLNEDVWSFCYRVILQKKSNFHTDQMNSGDTLSPTSEYLHEMDSLEKFSEDFARILASDTKKDVQLKCRHVVIKAHKTVLRARSEWFAKKLQTATEDLIEVPSFCPAVFHEIIKYIYTGKTPKLNITLAKNLYSTGELCEVGCLKQKCVDFFIGSLTEENACECLVLVATSKKRSSKKLLYIDEYFKKKIIAYIKNEGIYLRDDYWKPYCDKYPKSANSILNDLVREQCRK